MPVVPACDRDSVSVACNYSWNLDYDFVAVHSPAAEEVHRSPVEEENHSGGRAQAVAVNRRDFRSCLVEENHRDFRSCFGVAVAVPVSRNRSSPA